MMSSSWVREKGALAMVLPCNLGRRSCSACTGSVEECLRVLMGRARLGGSSARQVKKGGATPLRRVEVRYQDATDLP